MSDIRNLNELTRIMAELSLSSQSVESKTMSPKIQHLPELDSINDDNLLQVFWENRDTIFAYARVDIENTLAKRDLEVLQCIRVKLCDIASKLFPEYSEKVPIKRRVKNKVVNDIFNLGFSIINKNVTKEMENIYQKDSSVVEENNNDERNITDLGQLIAIVAKMRTDIETNSKEILKLKGEKQKMAEELKECRCKCVDNNNQNKLPVNSIQQSTMQKKDHEEDGKHKVPVKNTSCP